MSTAPRPATSVVPAQLAFLAIYNPSLGASAEESLEEQIVYYFHRKRSRRKRRKEFEVEHAEDNEEKNEKLRQVGLAQGMVQFARYDCRPYSVTEFNAKRLRLLAGALRMGNR